MSWISLSSRDTPRFPDKFSYFLHVIPRSHTEKQLLESLRTAAPSGDILRRCDDPARCTQLYRGILLRAATTLRNGATLAERHLERVLLDVPDPERVLLQLDRFLEASLHPGGILEDLFGDAALLDSYARLVSASRWLADTLVREAPLFRWLFASGVLGEHRLRPALRAELRSTLERFPQLSHRGNALRRFQRRELLRIAAADLLGQKDVRQVLLELSALADAVVAVALEEARTVVRARIGSEHESSIAVIALGKLGGEELNYSSDIDLMVIYAPRSRDRTHDFAIAVVREMLRILTEVTPEGMLYRTDLRLRPDGAAGALASPLPAMLTYYEERGALWERQMLLRARFCAGDAEFGHAVLQSLQPFIYPRTSMRFPSEIATDIRARLSERWTSERNVKHMRGGIRQIEFSLQLLQLLHAPHHPELRTPSTLASIDALARAELLTLEEEALLRDAYLFLRRVEHLLQLESFEQTHALPPDTRRLTRIAWALGFPNEAAFTARLDGVRAAVEEICAAMIIPREEDASPTLPDAFRDPVKVAVLLDEMLCGRGRRPRTHGERDRLHRLLPQLLEEAAAKPLPDETLASLESFLHHTASPSAVIRLLEQPRARRFLLHFAAEAPVQLRSLETDPLVLDLLFSGFDEEILDAGRFHRVRGCAALADFLLTHRDPDQYSAALTDTADVLLQRLYLELERNAPSLVVLAMGKYGGRELIPGSDLDVIFLFEGETAEEQEAAQAFARHLIAGMRGQGSTAMYEVDARLRPEGRSAPLAVSRSAWLRYLAERASLWEVQSLLRARIAAGDPVLAGRLQSDIRELHGRFILTPEQVDAIRRMRMDMEPRSRFRRTDFLDVKRSAGGLVDAEFAAQLLFLHRRWTGLGQTPAAFERLIQEDAADAVLLYRLRDNYLFLRLLQLFLRILLGLPGNLLPEDDDQRTRLAAVMGSRDGDTLLQEVGTRMRQNRQDFDAVCAYLASTDTNRSTQLTRTDRRT